MPRRKSNSSEEERWQRSLGNRAGNVASREFGNWENFKTPSSLVTLAEEAAEVWRKLAFDLEVSALPPPPY